MTVTRRDLADKLSNYLTHRLSLDELVDWAETAMMDAEFEEDHTEMLSNIIAKLGLADVRAFGLTWEDCERFLKRLGYRTQIDIVPI